MGQIHVIANTMYMQIYCRFFDLLCWFGNVPAASGRLFLVLTHPGTTNKFVAENIHTQHGPATDDLPAQCNSTPGLEWPPP